MSGSFGARSVACLSASRACSEVFISLLHAAEKQSSLRRPGGFCFLSLSARYGGDRLVHVLAVIGRLLLGNRLRSRVPSTAPRFADHAVNKNCDSAHGQTTNNYHAECCIHHAARTRCAGVGEVVGCAGRSCWIAERRVRFVAYSASVRMPLSRARRSAHRAIGALRAQRHRRNRGPGNSEGVNTKIKAAMSMITALVQKCHHHQSFPRMTRQPSVVACSLRRMLTMTIAPISTRARRARTTTATCPVSRADRNRYHEIVTVAGEGRDIA